MSNNQGTPFRIGKAAVACGLSTSSLRQYEELGLLLPQRDASGQRLYTDDDVTWVQALQEYFRETHTGPHSAALLLSFLPADELRAHAGLSACARAQDDSICWQSAGQDASLREECRACPAYQGKELALSFRDHFHVMLALPERSNGEVAGKLLGKIMSIF